MRTEHLLYLVLRIQSIPFLLRVREYKSLKLITSLLSEPMVREVWSPTRLELLLPILTLSYTRKVPGKQVFNVKVVIGKQCTSQDKCKLMIGGFRAFSPHQPKRKFVQHIKVWKPRDPKKQPELCEVPKSDRKSNEQEQEQSKGKSRS